MNNYLVRKQYDNHCDGMVPMIISNSIKRDLFNIFVGARCDIEIVKPLLIAPYCFLKAVNTMKLVYTEQDIWLIMNRTPSTLHNMNLLP